MMNRLMLACALLTWGADAVADTITWLSDSCVDHDWHNSSNWDLKRLPEAGDEVVLPPLSGSLYWRTTTTVSNTVPASGKFKKLTVKGQHILSFRGWNTKVSAEELELKRGTVYHAAITSESCSSTASNRVWLAADKLTVNSSTTIGAVGYGTGQGPGWEGVASKSGGGAYGGLAYSGMSVTYGSITEPTQPGTGPANRSTTGGGAVFIESNELKVDGSIDVTGGNQPYGWEAASGGSIYIRTKTISGSGSVIADGGGYREKTTGSCGGGGRIAVCYDATLQRDVTCKVSFSARGGYDNKNSGRYTIIGGCGTVYFTDDQMIRRSGIGVSGKIYYGDPVTRFDGISTDGDFLVKNALVDFGDGAVVSVGGKLTLSGSGGRENGILISGRNSRVSVGGDLEISGAEVRLSGGGNLTVGGNLTHKPAASALAAGEVWVRAMPTNGTDGAVCGSRVEVKGNWTVGSYGGVFPVCDPTNGAVVALVARNFSLTNTAEISANNAGWGATRGKGGKSDWTGASHGGLGCSWSGGHYGVCYGDKRKPLLPGSGGSAGSGGGVIWLETLHEMILNGTLSANGANSGSYCGAGSGGSVYLFCNRMLGGTTGAITANGGSGCSLGGAGGGGRIAIRYRCAAPDCVISTVASGGTYSGKGESFQGEAGTVFRKRIGGMTILVR